MKETLTFLCGHVKEVELPKDSSVRGVLRRSMEMRHCRTCDYRAQVQAATEGAIVLGLVSLVGTPKQIDYALILRDLQVSFFLRQVRLAERAGSDEKRVEQMQKHLFMTINSLPRASWWIEHQALVYVRAMLGDDWAERD